MQTTQAHDSRPLLNPGAKLRFPGAPPAIPKRKKVNKRARALRRPKPTEPPHNRNHTEEKDTHNPATRHHTYRRESTASLTTVPGPGPRPPWPWDTRTKSLLSQATPSNRATDDPLASFDAIIAFVQSKIQARPS
ncbi:hypothetical protein CGCSCA5_v001128 [Colletotrichum siamense]|uniref:uncharacterized protein n=1 Tax=Colletotrichum siamense TaxID=690259 RepID=UPI001872C4B3|nr:uncharacterized protein CGCS363_v005175 [Colletotrichum siamense]KAF4824204.1 hypothetical protein CGCSCA5_v001128 [Colletotrichum siamense]KAF5506445.1 hypothetical protein CGCS363_v005175 [Colletotrichum siamense]